ncbi:MAG: protein-L-isoaspartate(D-aspartate) O-methyltransferase [Gemmatimonadota bacterium]|nr:protein-L-isoaspartate(D-aspartate) O-methyltransferase [Gemmatimonadota bacterium]
MAHTIRLPALTLALIGLGLPGSAAAQADPYTEERERLVAEHIEGQQVDDPAVLAAMREVPRHLFIPEERRGYAYEDRPVPIGYGQTISQPSLVAYMTQLLELEPGMRVLEIGTGSGYQAAVLGAILDDVFTVEIIEELARRGGGNLREAGYGHVRVRHADGYYGWEEHAPYDAIIVTAAADHVPPPLIDQLKDGGRMVIPVGSPFRTQTLMLVTRDGEDTLTESLLPVRFVPLTRESP